MRAGTVSYRPTHDPVRRPMTYQRVGGLGLRSWQGDGANIVCFPCAGGDSLSFRPLAAALPDGYQVTALDLPGHGGALGFPVPSLPRLVQLSAAALVRQPVPVAVLGHSFGAYLAVEAARRLGVLDARWREVRVIVCSALAPSTATSLPSPNLPDDALSAELAGLGGIPAELVGGEWMTQFLPRIRADLAAAHGYLAEARWQREAPLDNRTLVITGAADPLCDPQRAGAWRDLVTHLDSVVIEAGHYLPQAAAAALAQAVDGWLASTDAVLDPHVPLGA